MIVLIGYFGPWVAHPVAGLVVTGLDLGEYVKFLPSVIGGELDLWRQGFYLPLITVALSCSFLAYREEYDYPFPFRLVLILLGIAATLNILPPAWSPAVLQTSEFRLQTLAILCSLGLLGISPLLRYIPGLVVYTGLSILAIAAAWYPLSGYHRIQPDLTYLYNQQIVTGWGYTVCALGLLLLIAAYWLGYGKLRAATFVEYGLDA